ncbi:hypothetical protein Agub_g12852 [Astrephomene gubernaculifera]|uniref:CBM20 domain-containing protein n=1 Tax=Astrephomene gubernaculifera TaxID=47775 RepID=A0AAD3DZA1_9CHLO|nr:hypothetical protein Agub_g12852 [Astrephomene gubernaculifera]
MRALQTRGPQTLHTRRYEATQRQASKVKPTWSRLETVAVKAASISVPVAISVKYKVEFGESLRLVGNQSFLGNWDPRKGADMSWTEGNIWKADARVPVGTEVNFKVVRVKPDGGEAVWEDGDNRSFKILGPDYGLNITCHWSRGGDMKVDAYRLGAAAEGAAGKGGQHQQLTAGVAGAANGRGNGVSSAAAAAAVPALATSLASADGDGNGRSPSSSFSFSPSSPSLDDASLPNRPAWVGPDPEFLRSRRPAEAERGRGAGAVWRTEGLSGVELELVRGDAEAPSWLKKLSLQKRLLVDAPPACRPRLPELAAVYVYATWVGNGALPCAEAGSHYRPNHHANLALQMFRSLEWVIGDAASAASSSRRNPAAEALLLAARRLHARLPSFSGQFRQSVPLTRIRDIAHRNDIPHDLKQEIKHTLQNKLHRSAGPEDLVATEAMLARLTSAPPGTYPPAFIAEFETFTRELREFFNAEGLVDLLTATLESGSLDEQHAGAVRQLLGAKQRVDGGGAGGKGAGLDDLMNLMTAVTQARSYFAAGLVAGLRNDVTEEVLALRQRWRLADIRLEEFAFVVLSRIAGLLEEQGAASKLPRAPNHQWSAPLAALTCGLRHMGLSLYDTRELMCLENELQRWHGLCPLVETRDAALRARATLDRVLRVAGQYGDAVAGVYGSPARQLGAALGLPEHMGAVFAESEVRSSVAFQVSRLAALLVRALRAAAGQEAWDVLVPGDMTGTLQEVPQLDAAALAGGGGAPSSNGSSNGSSTSQQDEEGEGVVLVVRRAEGDEELGPLGRRLRGVVLLQELPHLSHLGVRARQEGVPFVTCDDEETASRVLRPLLGRSVTVSAGADGSVSVRQAAAVGKDGTTGGRAAAAKPPLQPPPSAAAAAEGGRGDGGDEASVTAVSASFLGGRWGEVVVPLDVAAEAAGRCGAKAAKCGSLAALAGQSGGLFAAPAGAVLPYGAMEAAVAAAGRQREYEELLGRLEEGGVVGAELEAACGEMRALIGGLEVPAGLVREALSTLKRLASSSSSSSSSSTPAAAAASSPQAPLQQQQQPPLLLAVRSSANVEDLAGMAAAGLYDSVVGVPAEDEAGVAAAVAEVWASLYTRRAVLSRRSAGVRQSSARMAVLLQQLVAPDLSFVLHTARPRDGSAEVLLAEVAAGQGETLAAGTRGSPWRFEVVKSSGQVTTLAFANFSTALVLPGKGKSSALFAAYASGASTASASASTASMDGNNGPGTTNGQRKPLGALVERDVDYSTQRMSVDNDWRLTVVRQMAAVGSYIEGAMGGVAQDIEGGVVLGPDGSVSMHVFQTRPQ